METSETSSCVYNALPDTTSEWAMSVSKSVPLELSSKATIVLPVTVHVQLVKARPISALVAISKAQITSSSSKSA